MNPSLLLAVQSVLLPLALSGLLWRAARRHGDWQPAGMALAWLAAYAWIVRWPALPPGEATDWLWLVLVAGLAAGFPVVRHRTRWCLFTLLSAGMAVAIAWPVLRYQPSVTLGGELLAVVIVAGFLSARGQKDPAPALTLGVQAGGLAIASALGGSLLVGQLAGALAAAGGIHAVVELWRRQPQDQPGYRLLPGFLPLYLALLLIARIYAELPLATTALLLAGTLPGVLLAWRHGWVISLLLNAAAVGLLLLDSGSTGYY